MGTNARLCLAAAVAALVAVSATQGVKRWRFCTMPEDTTAKVGERVVLHCEPPYANPAPEVTWYKDGIMLEGLVNEEEEELPKKCEKSDDRIVLAELGDLVIKAVEKTDAGLYVCKVTNDAGERQTEPAYLTVIEEGDMLPPMPTRRPGETIKDDLMDPFAFDFNKTMVWKGINYKGKVFKQGGRLELDDVNQAPKVKFPSTLAGCGFCTIMMTDPDSLGRGKPKFRSLLHWLVANLPCESGKVDLSQGDVLGEYGRPWPAIGSHRFVFFAFRHKEALERGTINRRHRFRMEKFVVDHGLGSPKLATYFVAKWSFG